MRLLALFAASVIVFTGCAAGEPLDDAPEVSEATDTTEQPIINGTVNNAAYPGVGRVESFRAGSSAAIHRCTGTLIQRKTVLTAAHCLRDGAGHAAGARFWVAAENRWVYAERWVDNGNDVAVVTLYEWLWRATPHPVIRRHGPAVGEGLTIAGYGNFNASGGNDGQKRTGESTVTSVAANDFRFNGALNAAHDSGGPAFQRGTQTLLGVMTNGDSRTVGLARRLDGGHFDWINYQLTNGEIRARYDAIGGRAAFGYATTDELPTQCGGGLYNNFEGGAITWGPRAGAHATYGGIRAKWASVGYECSRLGFPTSDESPGGCWSLRYNTFEGGAIVWTPQFGAFLSVGSLREAWGRTGYECGPLGPPTSDEWYTGSYYQQNFANGWARSYGSYNVCYASGRYVSC